MEYRTENIYFLLLAELDANGFNQEKDNGRREESC